MPSIICDFEVYCDTCGAGLCGQTRVKNNAVHVAVCENCLEKARDEARDEGYTKGEREGRAAAEDQNR